jgi:hypothetical protein
MASGHRLTILVELESTRRSTFMFTNKPPIPGAVASSSTEGNSQTPLIVKARPRTSAISIEDEDEDEDEEEGEYIETFDLAPLPQSVEAAQSVPAQGPIPTPVGSQPITASIELLHDGLEAVMFVSPQEIFGPHQSAGSAGNMSTVVSTAVPQLPPARPFPVFGSSQAIIPDQVTGSPMLSKLSHLVPAPILGSPQMVTPHNIDTRQISQAVPSHPVAVSPMVSEIPHLVPSSDLDTPYQTSQAVPSHLVAISPMISEISHLVPSSDLGSSPITPPRPSVVHNLSAAPGPQVARVLPQSIGPHRPSNLAEEVTSGGSRTVVTPRSIYKTRDRTNAVPAHGLRRDSIEGVPEVILTLGGSGYELVTASEQPDISTAPPSTTSISTAPSPTTAPSTVPSDEFIVPSSQGSFEELTIPMNIDASLTDDTSPTGESATPSLQQSPEEPSITISPLFNCRFALRIIPTYQIDRSDFPSWFQERGRLDAVLSVEGGGLWERLISAWLRQERRVGFGLNEKVVSERFRVPV